MTTITVRRANVVLDVPEEQRQEYLAKGFDVIDESTGAVIEATVPVDVNVLKKAYVEHLKKIAELEKEIAELKAKPVRPTIKPVIAKPVEDANEVPEEKPVTKTSKSSRSKK